MPADAPDPVEGKIEHARTVERALTRLGWSVVVIGSLGIAGIAVFLAIGEIDIEQALGTALGTVLASILSGAAAYGSGVNIGLGAERLALAREQAGRRTNGG
ncbi:MAG: hypothetical protein U0R70_08240 [Solirubrobacteraceae bacterium]